MIAGIHGQDTSQLRGLVPTTDSRKGCSHGLASALTEDLFDGWRVRDAALAWGVQSL